MRRKLMKMAMRNMIRSLVALTRISCHLFRINRLMLMNSKTRIMSVSSNPVTDQMTLMRSLMGTQTVQKSI